MSKICYAFRKSFQRCLWFSPVSFDKKKEDAFVTSCVSFASENIWRLQTIVCSDLAKSFYIFYLTPFSTCDTPSTTSEHVWKCCNLPEMFLSEEWKSSSLHGTHLSPKVQQVFGARARKESRRNLMIVSALLFGKIKKKKKTHSREAVWGSEQEINGAY